MKEKLYLIPTVTTNTGLPMEYRMILHKEDYRHFFCKENKDRIVNPIFLCNMISNYRVRVKGDRVIMPNANIAVDVMNDIRSEKRDCHE